MTRQPEPRAPEGSAARGLQRLEGYLLCEAEKQRARTEAEEFAQGLPWLTGEQYREVTRRYAELRLAETRKKWAYVRSRSLELQSEYSTRYGQLRRRLVCVAFLLLGVMLFLDALWLAWRG